MFAYLRGIGLHVGDERGGGGELILGDRDFVAVAMGRAFAHRVVRRGGCRRVVVSWTCGADSSAGIAAGPGAAAETSACDGAALAGRGVAVGKRGEGEGGDSGRGDHADAAEARERGPAPAEAFAIAEPGEGDADEADERIASAARIAASSMLAPERTMPAPRTPSCTRIPPTAPAQRTL